MTGWEPDRLKGQNSHQSWLKNIRKFISIKVEIANLVLDLATAIIYTVKELDLQKIPSENDKF